MGNCIKHTECPACGSKDNLAVYDDGGAFCFTPNCDYVVRSPSTEGQKGKPKPRLKTSAGQRKIEKKEPSMTKVLTEEDKEEVKSIAGFKANNYRGISDETLKFFGCRTAVDEDGEPLTRYYPTTIDGELSGYKVRHCPKEFASNYGETGAKCDLYGSFRFKNGGKYVLIVGGEEDTMAAYQMFKDYADSKGSDFITAVVSPTIGEACAKQLANNYEFLNQFDNVILGLDNDEAGIAATEKVVSSLPKGKVKIATWTHGKDPNEVLMKGKASSFIRDFYAAKPYVPAGVLSSDQLYQKIIEQACLEKLPMPPFLRKAEQMMGGGLALGHILNVAAWTSIGKTAIVNEMIYYWIFNSPHLVGVVSMELNSGQYGETILSRHIQQKLARLDKDQKLEALSSEYMQQKGKELFQKEDGSPRFYLVDDRDGTVEHIQDVIEEMVISSGVKIIVIDPLQDLIEGMSNEEQGLFMKWCKSVIKSHNVSFVLINHMRKKASGEDGIKVSESDIMGSSTISKSASYNILLARDKDAEDPIERNTTYITMSKSRLIGETGPAGKIYYDNMTHTMHDFDEYWSSEKPPVSEPSQKALKQDSDPFGDMTEGSDLQAPNDSVVATSDAFSKPVVFDGSNETAPPVDF